MRARYLVAVALAIIVGAVLPVAAGATPYGMAGAYKVQYLRTLSGLSPFPNGNPEAAGDSAHLAGYEAESSITVNPRYPGNIIASWMQDNGPGVAARTNLVASSRDFGRTWTRSVIPGLTIYTGGTRDASADPWLSAGADGTVYSIGVSRSLAAPGIAEILASTSRDGGLTWAASPASLAPPDPRNDKPVITADPVAPRRAYALWANWDQQQNFPFANFLMFARTNDRGATWSEGVVVDAPPENAVDISSAMLVLPWGRLLTIFERIEVNPDFSFTEKFFSTRSVDGGQTWLPPVEIGSMPIVPLLDPETGEPLPQPGFLSAATGRDGSAYVTWERQSSPTSGAVDVARSFNGGRTWAVSSLPGVSSFTFEPSVAVDSTGTVGITWYDLRNDKPGDAALTADVWFASSRDRAASWRQIHVAGPTDLMTASLVAQNRVGEYQGLAALRGRGFAAVFTLASPQARDGQTDIFFARIGPSR